MSKRHIHFLEVVLLYIYIYFWQIWYPLQVNSIRPLSPLDLQQFWAAPPLWKSNPSQEQKIKRIKSNSTNGLRGVLVKTQFKCRWYNFFGHYTVWCMFMMNWSQISPSNKKRWWKKIRLKVMPSKMEGQQSLSQGRFLHRKKSCMKMMVSSQYSYTDIWCF